ncbi:unnamed protein product [Candida verbasci]|uniref:CCZ1/INTU/HSP4 first Longin domain-containing protein n=1 Tax=Candida verbasci TaxID=1227364 RepID=A0A9W4XCP2_9ASCO|nr:unnamed protein product [Candida verbasci]
MNFSQYIPTFNNYETTNNTIELLPKQAYPNINYISIFNPTLVSSTSESNEELLKQIIIFINDKTHGQIEQLKIVGLIRGIQSLVNEFTESEEPLIIKSETESSIVIQLESNYFIIFNISTTDKLILHQLSELIAITNRRFTLFNKPLHLFYDFDKDVLRDSLVSYWTNFKNCYNSSYLKYPPTLNWINNLNYKGFLGLFPYYKSSSSKLNNLELKERIEDIDQTPKGIIISCFNDEITKKNGIIYKDSSGLEDDSLIDIFNWLEFNNYHAKTFEENEFISNLPKQKFYEDGGALQTLNPVNLGHNLVVTPLNYTVSSVSNIYNEPSSWLTMPKFITNLTTTNEEQPLPKSQDSEATEDTGTYLIGLNQESISRKIVYIKSISGEIDEYQLILFQNGNFYITLIYESSNVNVDNPTFYSDLQPHLNLIIDDLIQYQSNLSNSISSLKSIYNNNQQQEIDSDFFYVIFDKDSKSFQTSLPYLPYITNLENEKIRYWTAIYYLHNQIFNLFADMNCFQFDEFFHKCTTNKLNNWMFYYLKYKNKNIIIIKNKNKHHKVNERVVVEKGLIDKLSDGIYEYGSLGFIENLTDDIKYWLGQVN